MTPPNHSDGEGGLNRLLAVVRRLRGEGGCPWDREQTLESLKPHLIEETYELADAIDAGDPARHLDELGDVLLHIALQAQIRDERGDFDMQDVADAIADKLIRRHPHVFTGQKVAGTDEVLRNWQAIKSQEKESREPSVLDDVPRSLPSLMMAQRVQTRAAGVGFDWSDVKDVLAKVEEELAETRAAIVEGCARHIEEEIGDLLFAVVNLSRFQRVNAEDALRRGSDKFMARFRTMEKRLRERRGDVRSCSAAEMDAEWESVKKADRELPPGSGGAPAGR